MQQLQDYEAQGVCGIINQISENAYLIFTVI